METQENTIELFDLSPEVLQIVAEVCLESPASLAALAATCTTLHELIYLQQSFWKGNTRRIFGLNVAEWTSVRNFPFSPPNTFQTSTKSLFDFY
jgi:hypothetical protein